MAFGIALLVGDALGVALRDGLGVALGVALLVGDALGVALGVALRVALRDPDLGTPKIAISVRNLKKV